MKLGMGAFNAACKPAIYCAIEKVWNGLDISSVKELCNYRKELGTDGNIKRI